MKGRFSFIACLFVILVLLVIRTAYLKPDAKGNFIITKWDAFGYYLYNPGAFIYNDLKSLSWAEQQNKQFALSGDHLPTEQLPNGNQVDKYLCGVAILQLPWFFVGHFWALAAGQPATGMSPPYQLALAFGILVYLGLSLFILRKVLLQYFTDRVAALCIVLVCLATNFPQYASVDSGLSHAWIFVLYVFLLYSTIRWHEDPQLLRSLWIGLLIGLMVISRPTEALAVFIPLLWKGGIFPTLKSKWAYLRKNMRPVACAVGGGLLAILPQLLYWKHVTGSFIYDVGSKWVFLNPWFRVLVGWEKGWFIYTPVTILFVLGLLALKRHPFRLAVLVFCFLNIWIIISWDEWRYGASYSTRALAQSYPVFSLALGSLIARVRRSWAMYLLVAASIVLIGINLFQIYQYNAGIIHHDDMNRRYYSRVFLNPNPSPLDMSLLDHNEYLDCAGRCVDTALIVSSRASEVNFENDGRYILAKAEVSNAQNFTHAICSLEVATQDRWANKIGLEVRASSGVQDQQYRMDNPVANRSGCYEFHTKLPVDSGDIQLAIYLSSDRKFSGVVKRIELRLVKRQ